MIALAVTERNINISPTQPCVVEGTNEDIEKKEKGPTVSHTTVRIYIYMHITILRIGLTLKFADDLGENII